jgi:hypothetical protein
MKDLALGFAMGAVIALAFTFGLSLIPDERVPLDPNDAVWGIK